MQKGALVLEKQKEHISALALIVMFIPFYCPSDLRVTNRNTEGIKFSIFSLVLFISSFPNTKGVHHLEIGAKHQRIRKSESS